MREEEVLFKSFQGLIKKLLPSLLAIFIWNYSLAEEIREWQVLGPFLSAPQEKSLDPLDGGSSQLQLRPDDREYFSALAKGGKVKWFKIKARHAHVKCEYPQVDWDFLRDRGGPALTANLGYFYTEIERQKEEILLVKTQQVGEFFINGQRYFGDPYRYGFAHVPVPFIKGKNEILLKLSSIEDPEFEFQLSSPESPILIAEDITKPDLSEKLLSEFWMGVPLINTTQNWFKDLHVKILKDDVVEESLSKMEFSLAPLSTLKVPIRLRQYGPALENHKISVEIYAAKQKISESKIELNHRKREKDQGLVETFVSMWDGSIQHYLILFPKKFNPEKTYDALILLHGANVEAATLGDRMAPKDWAFVIAPTNRRPHGFAYQDLGRLDVLEVIEKIQKKYSINRRGIFLLGHSMGAQGVWHIGTHHPSLFQGLAPTAGWSSFKLYTPFLYQQAELFSSPSISAFRDRVIMDSNNPYYIENIQQLPIFISQAGKDEVVPAFHSRLMHQLASKTGATTKYREIDSDAHWFEEPLNEDRGFDSMDHPAAYEFMKSNAPDAFPKNVRVRLTDLGIEKDFYWLRIEEQEKIFTETKVNAEILEHDLRIRSSNIKSLSLDLPKDFVGSDHLNIDWNHKRAKLKIPNSRKLHLRLDTSGLKANPSKSKKPLEQHALKSAFFSPYVIVYGTQGSEEESNQLLHRARLFAYKAWTTANSFAPILKDVEVTDQIIKNYNLILMGSARYNLLAKKWADRLPLKLSKNGIRFGREQVLAEDGGLAYAFIFPNPVSPRKYLVNFGGTDFEAEKFSNYFQAFYDRLGYGVPDFVIFSREVERRAWAGVEAVGFFSKTWDLSNSDYVKK